MNRESPVAASAEPPDAQPAVNLLGEWANSTTPAYCRDLCGRILAANGAFARKFGQPLHELAGRDTTRFINPDDLASYEAAEAELARPPHAAASSHRWLTPQGWRWISWEELTLFDAEGTPVAVRAIGHDITRQRLAEELYYKLSRAVEQSPVGMVITDAEGRVQYVNPKFTEVSGLTLEDILDRNIPVLREGHATDEDYERFWSVIRAGGDWQGELSRKAADGSVIWESTKVSCLRNSAGQISNFLCLREDITERKRLEEDLRQAQKMESLGTLAGGIAHDFNNVLAAINGYAELARMRLKGNPDVHDFLGSVLEAAGRATDLVRQILTFSRHERPERRPLALRPVVEEAFKLLRASIPSTIEFDLIFSPDAPAVLADASQVHQILMNLGTNAWHAMGDRPGRLQVRLETRLVDEAYAAAQMGLRPGTYARISVSDTGSGMEPATLRRIFEPFFTTKPVGQGTGLGLAVVHGIMANHDGAVTVYSQPGEGTVFHLYFPAHVGETTPVVTDQGSTPLGHGELVLFVDDEELLVQLGRQTLTELGYTVEIARNPAVALELVRSKPSRFALVITDQTMPGMTGLVLASELQRVRPGLPIILMTGYGLALTPEQIEAAGIHQLLIKPTTIHALGTAVHAALATATGKSVPRISS